MTPFISIRNQILGIKGCNPVSMITPPHHGRLSPAAAPLHLPGCRISHGGKGESSQLLLTEDPQAASPHWVELCGLGSNDQQSSYLFSEDTKTWSVYFNHMKLMFRREAADMCELLGGWLVQVIRVYKSLALQQFSAYCVKLTSLREL